MSTDPLFTAAVVCAGVGIVLVMVAGYPPRSKPGFRKFWAIPKEDRPPRYRLYVLGGVLLLIGVLLHTIRWIT